MHIGLCTMAGLIILPGGCNSNTRGTNDKPALASPSMEAKEAENIGAVRLFTYVIAKSDPAHPERIPTQVAITGELGLIKNCLILQVGDSRFNLMFAKGTAVFNQENQTLTVEGNIFPLGAKVSMGGAGMGVVESMPEGDPSQICGIKTNWVVTSGSFKPAVGVQ
jgi:hypothetical protein